MKQNRLPFFFIFILTLCFLFYVSVNAAQIAETHNKVTEAYFLSPQKIYQDQIAAYAFAYYQISIQDAPLIQIESNQKNDLIPKILDEQGNVLAYKKNATAGGFLLSIDHNLKSEHSYLFLELYNHSVEDINLEICLKTSNHTQVDTPKPDTPKPNTPKPDTPKPDTPKPDTPKSNTPKPDTPKPNSPKPDTPKPNTPKPDTPKPDTPKPNTPKPDTPKSYILKPNTVIQNTPNLKIPQSYTSKPMQEDFSANPTITPKNNRQKSEQTLPLELLVTPHFVMLKPGQQEKLTMQIKTQGENHLSTFPEQDFIWMSTCEETAVIENGILTAKQEGSAIIYLKHKTLPELRSSALIRVCISI